MVLTLQPSTLKGESYRVLTVNGDIAAYIYVLPNGKLTSGQQAKHPQCLKEAVGRGDLRPYHVLGIHIFTCGVLA